jgi:hypothetical protein
MTIGANSLGLVVFVPLLSQWFVRRRGMAISIVQSANSFGRAASAPLAQLPHRQKEEAAMQSEWLRRYTPYQAVTGTHPMAR